MKKSLFAAMAAAALMAATAASAAPTQTKMELTGKDAVGKVTVINPGGSDGMTAKYAPATITLKKSTDLSANATNFAAAAGKALDLNVAYIVDKSSLGTLLLGSAADKTPLKPEVVADNKAPWFGAKKPDLAMKAPASTTLIVHSGITLNPPKNGSSDTIVGTGAQFTLAAASRSPARSRST